MHNAKCYVNAIDIGQNGCSSVNSLAKMSDRIAISFIKMLREGPEVSFNGSPTVSPTTAALWISEPFLTTAPWSSLRAPLSIYFLALSQAPPVLEAEIASWTPLTRDPGKKPARMVGPKMNPSARGVIMT